MKRFAIIDFETTGLRAGQDRIIEVAAVAVSEGGVVGTFSELMDPGFRIPSFITSLTGISDAMVRGRSRPEAVMPRLREFLGDQVCLAHNASFDQRFFAAEMALAGQEHERTFVCSMLLARRLLPEAPSHKLGSLIQHLRLPTPPGLQAHRALADALMTCSLWNHLHGLLCAKLHGRRPGLEIIQAVTKTPANRIDAYLGALA